MPAPRYRTCSAARGAANLTIHRPIRYLYMRARTAKGQIAQRRKAYRGEVGAPGTCVAGQLLLVPSAANPPRLLTRQTCHRCGVVRRWHVPSSLAPLPQLQQHLLCYRPSFSAARYPLPASTPARRLATRHLLAGLQQSWFLSSHLHPSSQFQASLLHRCICEASLRRLENPQPRLVPLLLVLAGPASR